MNSLSDPATLRDREGVEYVEHPPETSENHYEAYADRAGTVVVGTVDDAGRLALLEHDAAAGRRPPLARVAAEADFLETAREAARRETGLPVTVDEVLRVRHHTYRTADGRETTGHDVVVAATPTGDGEVESGDGDWTPAWFDPAAVEVQAEGKAGDDLRLLVEYAT